MKTFGQDRVGSDGRVIRLITLSIAVASLIYLMIEVQTNPIIIALDKGIFILSSEVTRQSWAFDTLIVKVFRTHTAKMLPMILCAGWLVMERRRKGLEIRFFPKLIMGTFIAMASSRIMQNFALYRPRPLHEKTLELQLPHGVDTSTLEGWSSFPSDTSALGFAIAAGIFLASRRLGAISFLWTAVVVALPRAYSGLHYPSDLLAGALIGILSTCVVAPLALTPLCKKCQISIDSKYYPIIWIIVFFYMFNVVTMFDDIRGYGSYLNELLI